MDPISQLLLEKELFFEIITNFLELSDLVQFDVATVNPLERKKYIGIMETFPNSNETFFFKMMPKLPCNDWVPRRNKFSVFLQHHASNLTLQIVKQLFQYLEPDKSNYYHQLLKTYFAQETFHVNVNNKRFDCNDLMYLTFVSQLHITGYSGALNNTPINQEQEESNLLLPYFPYLTKLTFSHCQALDETLIECFTSEQCPQLQSLEMIQIYNYKTNINVDLLSEWL
jgi:hypothetical protein